MIFLATAGIDMVMQFKDGNNDDVYFVFPYLKENVSSAAVENLVTSLITNGSIYETPPVSVVSAKMIVRDETEFI